MPDDRLSLSVTHSDGTVTRWGPDEADAGDVPGDTQFSTSVPGGFTSLNCSLLREIDPRADEALFDTVKASGPGRRTAWEGRIAQLPRAGGRSARLEPGAVGWSSHLEDNQSFREVYVDRDPGAWGGASITRRANQIASGFSTQESGTVAPGGALHQTLTGAWAATSKPLSEAVYDAGAGVPIGKIIYAWTKGANIGLPDPNWNWSVQAWTDAVGSSADTSGNLVAAGPGSGTLTTTGSNKRYGIAQAFFNTGPAGVAGMQYTIDWTTLVVLGTHGLTTHAGTDGKDGVYASDVIANVIGRAAPLLTYTTGATGSIQPTTFSIPHLAFKEPTTAADVVATTNAYHNWDWAVWDNKTFYYNAAGSGTQWQARIGDGAQLSLEGDTADQIINGVIVSYQDGGVSKLAGPVGSGCDVTSSSLQDSSTDNPATAHSITKKWPVLPISFPTTDAGAVQLGAIYLAERNLASRKGTLTLSGSVRHPTEGMVPCWRVRAGDTVTVSDQAGSPVRRIIATSYTHSQRQTVLTLDSTAHKLDALLSRLLSVTSALS